MDCHTCGTIHEEEFVGQCAHCNINICLLCHPVATHCGNCAFSMGYCLECHAEQAPGGRCEICAEMHEECDYCDNRKSDVKICAESGCRTVLCRTCALVVRVSETMCDEDLFCNYHQFRCSGCSLHFPLGERKECFVDGCREGFCGNCNIVDDRTRCCDGHALALCADCCKPIINADDDDVAISCPKCLRCDECSAPILLKAQRRRAWDADYMCCRCNRIFVCVMCWCPNDSSEGPYCTSCLPDAPDDGFILPPLFDVAPPDQRVLVPTAANQKLTRWGSLVKTPHGEYQVSETVKRQPRNRKAPNRFQPS